MSEETPGAVQDLVDVLSPHTGRTTRLTALEQAILDFETRRWRSAGPKESAIREDLGITATRYYQVLNGLLEDERAIAYNPVLLRALRTITVRTRHTRPRRQE